MTHTTNGEKGTTAKGKTVNFVYCEHFINILQFSQQHGQTLTNIAFRIHRILIPI